MAQYETVCVVKPDVQGDRLTKITDKVQKILADFKGEKFTQTDWGIRKLAYPIQKFKTAHYLYFVFEGGGGLVSELERQLNYDDAILRYMTMKVSKIGRTDIKPDVFQFARSESESFGHPFGGPDRRERRDFRGDRGDRFGDRGPRENREPRDAGKETPKEAKEE